MKWKRPKMELFKKKMAGGEPTQRGREKKGLGGAGVGRWESVFGVIERMAQLCEEREETWGGEGRGRLPKKGWKPRGGGEAWLGDKSPRLRNEKHSRQAGGEIGEVGKTQEGKKLCLETGKEIAPTREKGNSWGRKRDKSLKGGTRMGEKKARGGKKGSA